MYGKRNPLAMRRPLSVSESKKSRARKVHDLSPILSSIEDNADQLTTPTVTEGESATDTELETECEGETTPKDDKRELVNLYALDPVQRATSQHDLHNKYFRRDVVGLHNIDLFRQVPKFWSEHTYPNLVFQFFRCHARATNGLCCFCIVAACALVSHDPHVTLHTRLRLVHLP